MPDSLEIREALKQRDKEGEKGERGRERIEREGRKNKISVENSFTTILFF